jgi:hypothetical protein
MFAKLTAICRAAIKDAPILWMAMLGALILLAAAPPAMSCEIDEIPVGDICMPTDSDNPSGEEPPGDPVDPPEIIDPVPYVPPISALPTSGPGVDPNGYGHPYSGGPSQPPSWK